MKQILLSQGKIAIVDDWNYHRLNRHKWHVIKFDNCFYAARSICYPRNKRIFMHHQVLDCSKGLCRHHINRNSLDNRVCNLINLTNQRHLQIHKQGLKSPKGTSRYIGVSWKKGKIYKNKQYDGTWYAQICYNQKRIYIGLFDFEIEAAKAYDNKARELFGKDAKLNF